MVLNKKKARNHLLTEEIAVNLLELQTKIHEQNKAVGWWDNPRPFSTFSCLLHSELSEAMEGDRKNLMDDHLPEYEMFWVELSGFAIRCMDWLGSKNHSDYNYCLNIDHPSRTHFLDAMHNQVSSASSLMCDPYYKHQSDPMDNIASSVECCVAYAKLNDVDLLKIMLEKVAYNLTRADHKRENRALSNGKKY